MNDLREWIDTILKIILAIAGMVVGYYFSFQKQQNEDIQLIVEMITSKESAKRNLAVSIATEYLIQKRIPEAFYVSVYSYGNSSEDKELRSVVNSGASAALAASPKLQQALDSASLALPIRIYFHVRENADKVAARRIQEKIESAVSPLVGNKIIVPGIEFVKGAQDKSLLKCFKKAECDAMGVKLVALFKENGVPIVLSDQSKIYEKSTLIRPNHFEAWFAPGVAYQDNKS